MDFSLLFHKLMTELINKLHDYAEDTSHAFLGEARQGPFNPDHSSLQRGLAHGLGYAFSPLRAGMEYVSRSISDRVRPKTDRGGRERSRSHIPQENATVASMVSPATDKKKTMASKPKNFKKNIKNTVKKTIKKFVRPKTKTTPATIRGRKAMLARFRSQNYRSGRKFVRTVNFSNSKAAPVSVGFVRSQPGTMRWLPGTRPGCVRLRGKAYLGSLVNFQDSANRQNAYFNVAEAARIDGTPPNPGDNFLVCQLNVMPQNNFYWQGTVRLLAILFERYQVRTKLEYRPSSTTTTPGAIKLAYYDDPCAMYEQSAVKGCELEPLMSYPTVDTSINSFDIANNNTVTEFSLWRRAFTKWTTIQKKDDYKYIGAVTYNEQMDPSILSAADMRQPIQGAWFVTSTGLPSTGSTHSYAKIGEIWIHYDLELCDLMSYALGVELPEHLSVEIQKYGVMVGRRPFSHSISTMMDEKLKKLELAVKRLKEQTEQSDEKEGKKTEEKVNPLVLRRRGVRSPVEAQSRSASKTREEEKGKGSL